MEKEVATMTWEIPTFVEIKMDSEIGAYQDDFEERKPVPAKEELQPEPTEA